MRCKARPLLRFARRNYTPSRTGSRVSAVIFYVTYAALSLSPSVPPLNGEERTRLQALFDPMRRAPRFTPVSPPHCNGGKLDRGVEPA